MSDETRRVLLFCDSTIFSKNRSGIHRVAVELARALSDTVKTDLVRWNEIDGQLRFLDQSELNALFFGDIPPNLRAQRAAHRVNTRFGDLLTDESTVLLFPEIAYHMDQGNETLARIISQCREYGVATACIYYDAIPVTNDQYSEISRPHTDYLVELSRLDHILPISETSGQELLKIYAAANLPATDLSALDTATSPVLLPEGNTAFLDLGAPKNSILFVGTIEPRKRQTEALECINELAQSVPELRNLSVDFVGSLHPAVEKRFFAALEQNSRATYHRHISDIAVKELYKSARFSVFASNDEGYGLPISESLAFGVPCLTANFGSMNEIAAGGGCLTVNVNDLNDLKSGLRAMATDDALLEKLRADIGKRAFRTWGNYAEDLLKVMFPAHPVEPKRSAKIKAKGLSVACVDANTVQAVHSEPIKWVSNTDALPETSGTLATGMLWDGDIDGFRTLSDAERHSFYNSDIVGFVDRETYLACLDQCRADEFAGLFAPNIVINEKAVARQAEIEDGLRNEAIKKARRNEICAAEIRYAALRKHFARQGMDDKRVLSLVISTFNRSAFVTANGLWLANLVALFDGKVDLTVVDNASTDDSWASLQQLANMPNVTLIQNPANTGMLGNLNVCSTLKLARHVWVTGDDDFIVPEVLKSVVAHLEKDPGLPLGFVNFAVYHRAALNPGDTPRQLQSEGGVLCQTPAPDGLRRVADIAGEHDNLFTAVYPIIFRSDILAACFNYPFNGTPFNDLVESVPTTKIILETYGRCMAYWWGDVGTVGNAHNSWSRHRPRWHALLMPLVFEAARQTGVEQSKLRPWSNLHHRLYGEAIDIARENGWPVHLEEPQDLEPGTRVFRQIISVPDGLERWNGPAGAEWKVA